MALFGKKETSSEPIQFDETQARVPEQAQEPAPQNDIWTLDETVIATAEAGENITENNKGFVLKPEYFGPLREYVEDTDITDIDFNGTDLWITDINNRHWKDEKLDISPQFIRRLAQNIANSESKEFNQKNPVMEAETEDLRISIVHNSIAQTGTTMCIRKTPKTERITERKALESAYCTLTTLSLIVNCIKAHMNIIICGEPRAGKTECAKFISGFIKNGERVITIEDVLEWHYKALHPTADVIEMKVNNDFTYSDGIVASLKQNPVWIMIAETRGKEVKNLIQSFTTGVNGITTLHTDDVRKVPSRIVNMADDSLTAERMENNVYEFVDVALFISMSPDGNGGQKRIIDQVAFFTNENDNNRCEMVIEGGMLFKPNNIPQKILKKFKLAGVEDIYANEDVVNNLVKQGYDLTEKDFADKPSVFTSKLMNAEKTVFTINDIKQNIETPQDFTSGNVLRNLQH